MSTYGVEFTDDSLPPETRKCPKHNYWVKTAEIGRRGGIRIKKRMCMMCEMERIEEERKKGPAVPVKVRIMKI